MIESQYCFFLHYGRIENKINHHINFSRRAMRTCMSLMRTCTSLMTCKWLWTNMDTSNVPRRHPSLVYSIFNMHPLIGNIVNESREWRILWVSFFIRFSINIIWCYSIITQPFYNLDFPLLRLVCFVSTYISTCKA